MVHLHRIDSYIMAAVMMAYAMSLRVVWVNNENDREDIR